MWHMLSHSVWSSWWLVVSTLEGRDWYRLLLRTEVHVYTAFQQFLYMDGRGKYRFKSITDDTTDPVTPQSAVSIDSPSLMTW